MIAFQRVLMKLLKMTPNKGRNMLGRKLGLHSSIIWIHWTVTYNNFVVTKFNEKLL
jgi:hypothetical protein